MGLTFDPKLLLHIERWPATLVAALQDMSDEAGNRPLRPPEARKLLIQHIEPLALHLHPGNRIPGIYPTWQDFRSVGHGLESLAKNRTELCIGTLLIYLPDWCAYGRRKTRTPRVYCDLCWRHAANDRKFCFDHDQKNNSAAYRQGLRLRKAFYAQLKNLKTNEQASHCNRDWDRVLVGAMELHGWLSQHRPKTFAFLKEPEQITFFDLLSKLDSPDSSEPASIAQARRQLHARLLQDSDQIFGMLRRCEAWLEARQRKPHGGYRPNAGRKPMS